MSSIAKHKIIIQFYDKADALVAEEELEYEASYDDAMMEAETWAQAHLNEFSATYFEIS